MLISFFSRYVPLPLKIISWIAVCCPALMQSLGVGGPSAIYVIHNWSFTSFELHYLLKVSMKLRNGFFSSNFLFLFVLLFSEMYLQLNRCN